MNRLDFLKEMRSSLFGTVKEIYEPFVEDDLKKINQSADQLLGIHWFYVASGAESIHHLEQKYVAGKPIICFKSENEIRAYSGICPTCTNLLTISTFTKTCKCMHCDKQYDFESTSDDSKSVLTEFPVKQKSDGLYVGLKKSTLK